MVNSDFNWHFHCICACTVCSNTHCNSIYSLKPVWKLWLLQWWLEHVALPLRFPLKVISRFAFDEKRREAEKVREAQFVRSLATNWIRIKTCSPFNASCHWNLQLIFHVFWKSNSCKQRRQRWKRRKEAVCLPRKTWNRFLKEWFAVSTLCSWNSDWIHVQWHDNVWSDVDFLFTTLFHYFNFFFFFYSSTIGWCLVVDRIAIQCILRNVFIHIDLFML